METKFIMYQVNMQMKTMCVLVAKAKVKSKPILVIHLIAQNVFGRKYKTRYDIIKNYIKQSTVGKVRVEAIEDSIEISYMLKATGIGSGTIWYEDTLFATKEEANKSIDDKK